MNLNPVNDNVFMILSHYCPIKKYKSFVSH